MEHVFPVLMENMVQIMSVPDAQQEAYLVKTTQNVLRAMQEPIQQQERLHAPLAAIIKSQLGELVLVLHVVMERMPMIRIRHVLDAQMLISVH